MTDCILALTMNTSKWGAERSMCSLFDCLQKQGHKVLVVIPKEGEIIELLNTYGISYIVEQFNFWVYSEGEKSSCYRRFRKLIRDEKIARRIIKKVKEEGFRSKLVYSATLTFGTGLRISQILNIPHVQHIRENIDAFGFKFTYGYKLSLRYINKISTSIICTCNAVRDRYLKDLTPAHVFAVHNGVPPVEKISEKDYSGKIRVMQIARFMDDKRVIDSLQAIKLLVDNGCEQIKLDLYGKGPEQDMYEDFIKNNHLEDYVEIKGFVSQIDFAPYHVGLMTSTFEAFARSTLDYMNNGLAVIASNTGGNLEQVEDHKTGLFYNVLNPVDLANKLKYFIENKSELKKCGEEGRNRFLQMFTQEQYTSKASRIIISALTNG